MTPVRNYLSQSFLLLLLVIYALTVPGAVALHAGTIFLAPDGDDSASCAPGAVFATLARALECLGPGDTLIIRSGTYAGGVYVNVRATAEAPTVIRGESLDSAVVSGSGPERDVIRIQECSHVRLENLTVREATRAGCAVRFSDHVRVTGCRFADNGVWGIFTSFADDIRFERNECYGAVEQHGIYHSNSGDRFIIRDNIIHDNNGNGIHMNGDPEIEGGDGVLNEGVVERNVIYRNGNAGGAAINMTHVHDIIVRNNLLYRNRAGSITVYQDTGTFEQGSKRVLVYGNTSFFEPGRGRSGINVQTTSEKVVIAGNIFVSGGSRGNLEVNSDHLGTIISDRNIFWGVSEESLVERKDARLSLESWRSETGNDLHSLCADPGFRDPANDDFSLREDSPALDAGMPIDSVRAALESLGGCESLLQRLESLPGEDILRQHRPAGAAPDAGAYERQPTVIESYDFNRDSRFDIRDVLALLIRAYRGDNDPRLDLDRDGSAGVSDAVALARVLLDWLMEGAALAAMPG